MRKAMPFTCRNCSAPTPYRPDGILRRALVALTLLGGLGGCAYIADTSAQYRASHDIPDTSVLEVTQPLPVAAGRRDVYVQDGQVRSFGQIDRFYPHCEIVLTHLRDAPRELPAGEYRIFNARPYIDPYAQHDHRRWLAGLGVGADPAPSPQLYATRMQLQGPPDSDVKEMICGALFDPAEGRYPSIREINAVLGGLAHVRVQTASGRAAFGGVVDG